MRSSIACTERRSDTHIARLRPRPRPSLRIIEPTQLEGGRKGICQGREEPMTSEHEIRKGRERGDEPEESEQAALSCFRQQIEQFADNRKSCRVIRWKVGT